MLGILCITAITAANHHTNTPIAQADLNVTRRRDAAQEACLPKGPTWIRIYYNMKLHSLGVQHKMMASWKQKSSLTSLSYKFCESEFHSQFFWGSGLQILH